MDGVWAAPSHTSTKNLSESKRFWAINTYTHKHTYAMATTLCDTQHTRTLIGYNTIMWEGVQSE